MMRIIHFFRVSGVFLAVLTGCGSDDRPYEKSSSLEDFEDAKPLGETKNIDQDRAIKAGQKLPESESKNNKEVTLDDNSNEIVKESDEPLAVQLEIKTPKKAYAQSIGILKREFSDEAKIIQLTENLEFTPLVVERYKVLELSNNSKNILLDQKIYTEVFNSSMPAISKVAQTISNGLWVGFTNGEVISFKNNIWSKRSGGPASKKVAIKDILETDKGLFIASRGLYQYDEKADKFMSSDVLKNELITDIKSLDNDTLIFTTPSSIQSLSILDKTTKVIYNSFTGDYPITNVFVSKDRIEIGGKQGILSLSKNGFPISRTGTSLDVKQICNLSEGRGFIVTASGQLIAFENENTFTPNDFELADVNNCFISSNNNIMLTVGGFDIYTAIAGDFFEYVRKNQKREIPEFSKVYLNACLAAEELITGGRIYSRQISSPVIDEERHVFFNGVQACPNRKGFMRADGLTMTVDNKSNLNLFEYNNRRTLGYPSSILSSDITKIFIDSKKNIYLGTLKGLFISDGNQWSKPENKELSEDYISDITEDSRGNIWISSRIQKSLEQSKDIDYRALHVKTISDSWAHFGKSSGIQTLGISTLEFRNNTLYFGTPYGLANINQNSVMNIFSKGQGVLDFIIENISIDSKERIWLSHGFFQNGISWIDGKKYFSSDQSQGLFSNRITASAEDDLGRTWIMDSGGEVGVYSDNALLKISKESKFYPERAAKQEFKP